MRKAFLMIVIAAVSQHAQAREARHGTRVAQVIAMTFAGDPEGGGNAGAGTAPAAFKVLEHRRRWTASHRLDSRSNASVIPMPLGGEGLDSPLAAGGVSVPPVDGGLLAPVSWIAVPSWMTTPSTPQTWPAPGCAGAAYAPSGLLRADGEARRRALFGMMSAVACEHGLPVGLFDALIIRESAYDPAVYSPKLAYGLTQLMPDTARGLGVDRYDPVQNLRGGARYLRQQLDRFGQVPLALAAYNAGPGRVRGGTIPAIAETQAYVRHVIGNWIRLTSPSTSRMIAEQPSRTVAPLSGSQVSLLSF